MYKMMVKVLANRLRLVIGSVVSHVQSLSSREDKF